MVVKIRCFPATYLEALSTSMSSNSQWKKQNKKKKKKKKKKNNHYLQKSIGGYDSDSQKMCPIEIRTTIKMFYILEICHLRGCITVLIKVNDLSIRQLTWGFPYWFSETYWLAEWRWKEYLCLNSFIQMKYLLAQTKIIIISYSLTK